MRGRRSVLAVAVFGLILILAPPALAGSPGTWEKIGADVGSSLYEPDAERTGDGYLHVVWSKDLGTSAEQIQRIRISGSGGTGSVSNVLSNAWNGVTSDPEILRDGAGLQIIFSGLYNIDSGHPLSKGTYYRITAGKSGATWSDPPLQIAKWGYAYANYGTGTTLTGSGDPVFAGPLNSEVFWDDDLNTGDADESFTINGGSILYVSLATDRDTGEVWAAWYDQGKAGVWVRRILPSLTPPQQAPGSTSGGSSLDPGQSVAMAAPPGGGVYVGYCVGYPSCTSGRVWEVGTNDTVTFPGAKGLRRIALSSGPAGRVWATWFDGTSVFASRSNDRVTKFGPVQKLGSPPKTGYIYKLGIEGSLGRGDVFANAQTTTGVFNIWHTQVLPGLKLAASPVKWDGDASKTVTFTVTDAGQSVANANVKLGTRSCSTGSGGTCKISFPKLGPQKLTAIATKAGFGKDTVTLTVLA